MTATRYPKNFTGWDDGYGVRVLASRITPYGYIYVLQLCREPGDGRRKERGFLCTEMQKGMDRIAGYNKYEAPPKLSLFGKVPK